MANKRMFSLTVVDTDRFLDMPVSTQALYFHLGLHGDDDGFVSSPQKITRAVGCNGDDLRMLAAKEFVIPFDNGVVVITDWKRNNAIKKDRYVETVYQAEKALLLDDGTGKYVLLSGLEPGGNQAGTQLEPNRLHPGSGLVPQDRIGKDSLKKKREEEMADKPPRSRFSPPSVDDVRAYCQEKDYRIDPERFVDYYTSNGWKVGKDKMKDWRASVRNWERRRKEESHERAGENPYAELCKGIGYRV